MNVDPPARGFERFVAEVEPRLRRALVASYRAQVGREATVDALQLRLGTPLVACRLGESGRLLVPGRPDIGPTATPE